ncbi:MAG: hypothetical protein H6Q77_893 [Gemmatimonadetes bacterium]|nr:hypothetical protein [Gemmatimonadota bacterium]
MRVPRLTCASGVLAILLAGAGVGRASAQVLGAPVTISMAATQPGLLTVTVQSGGVQSIPSLTSNAINPFPTPVQIFTQWDIRPNTGSAMSLVAYFSVPAQALTTGATNIPSSRVEARMTTGSVPAFTPITGNGVGGVGTPGGSVVLWTNNCFASSNAAACRRANRTDQLDLQLNLTGLTLPPGTYAGTLTLRAVLY